MKYALITVGALALIYIAVTLYLFRFATKRQNKIPDINDDAFMKPFGFGDALPAMRRGAEYIKSHTKEEIFIKAYDGVPLRAIYIPSEKRRGVMLLFHGYRSFPEFDFSCIIEKYNSMGFDVIAVTERAHGKSGGKHIGFGALERHDCASWAEYAEKRFGKEMPLVLDGISMGASTVLMSLALPLPESVRCVIADCGFTSPYEIIKSVCKNGFHIPPFLIMPIERLYFKMFAGYGMKECSTVDAVKNTDIPIFFLHGEADTFVPPYMTRQNAAACRSEHVLLTVPGAEHGRSYLVDKEKCDAALGEFLDKYIK